MAFACDAVLLDFDGVLVDSNAISERQMRTWAERHGVPFARIAAIHHRRPTVAAERLGVAPKRCVVVEDAPAGVAAARAAGARVIAVASSMSPAALTDADVVVAGLDDLSVEIESGALTLAWRAAIPGGGARYTGSS